jgi:alpha-L-fucosidase 2
MKKHLLCAIILLCSLYHTAQAQQNDLRLWYTQPAVKWTEALPIGNGRLGAMIYGQVPEEHLQFNEATLWTGGPRSYQREGAWQYLDTIRRLLFSGRQHDAEEIAARHFMGLKSNEAAYPRQLQAWRQQAIADTAFLQLPARDLPRLLLPTPQGWERTPGLEGVDGSVWFRKRFQLPVMLQGKDLVLNLGKIRDEARVFLNGHFIAASAEPGRNLLVSLPATARLREWNEIAVQVLNYNDKGGFTGASSGTRLFALYPQGQPEATGMVLDSNWQYQVRNTNPPEFPAYQASYQPFGDLWVRFAHEGSISNYSRELDISQALAAVSYTCNGVRYRREYLAAQGDNLIALHFSADAPAAISFTARLTALHVLHHTRLQNGLLQLHVQVKNGALKGNAVLLVQANGGSITYTDSSIVVRRAGDATLYLSAVTNFVDYTNVNGNTSLVPRMLRYKKLVYETLRNRHIAAYRRQFHTFSLHFTGDTSRALQLPTDERIRQFQPATDPGLVALYVQYARYLLLSASQPGGQATNLQGLWNDQLTPPWGSKYTTNINLQMNYWPADVLHLPQCTEPLFRLIRGVYATGQQTARAHYNLPGWVLHHNTDIWRGSAPINASDHGIWVTGAAWLSTHIWEHYQFTRDTDFLRRYYPIMRDAARFFAGFLVRDPATGTLISTPSNSPEHGGLVAGPTMDHQIIRELFRETVAAAAVLRTNRSLADTLNRLYPEIAPNRIGKYGQLQEWMQDVDNPKDDHRHHSHLWGVYPGTDISFDRDSALMQAARQSLLYRGNGGTGWSLAWKVNLWARFKDGNQALAEVDSLLQPVAILSNGKEKGGVYPNLFDAHPPFQIDGNFGGAAGVAEMLLQSQAGYLDLLPALPDALSGGSVKGLCARGGFVVDLTWQQGRLQQVTILSEAGQDCLLRYGNKQVKFATVKGKTYTWNALLTPVE